MNPVLHYKTIYISDIDSENNRNYELIFFLNRVSCDRLILGESVVHKFLLSLNNLYNHQFKDFWSALYNKFSREKSEIIFLTQESKKDTCKKLQESFLYNSKNQTLKLEVQFCKEMVLQSGIRKWYISSTNLLDQFLTNQQGIARFQSFHFRLLRALRFLSYRYNPEVSLVKTLLLKIQASQSKFFNQEFNRYMLGLAISRACDGIIYSDFEKPCTRSFSGIMFINSGYWTESFSALAEDYSGKWKHISYSEVKDATKDVEQYLKIQKKFFKSSNNLYGR